MFLSTHATDGFQRLYVPPPLLQRYHVDGPREEPGMEVGARFFVGDTQESQSVMLATSVFPVLNLTGSAVKKAREWEVRT